MMKKISLLFSLAVLTMLCAFSANAGFLVSEIPYVENENTKIVDHVVYKLQKDSNGNKYYEVFDWFDTKEASETIKEINIVPEIDGIKVTAIQRGIGTNSCVCDFGYYGNCNASEYWKYKNYSVKKVIIPNTITEIGPYFFSVLDGLEELIIPASVKTFTLDEYDDNGEMSTFVEMESLKKITFLGNVETLGGFWNCKKLESVVLKGNVRSLATAAFYGCTSLKSFDFSKVKESVFPNAFGNTGFTSVTVPLKFLDSFENCKKLTKIVFTEDNSSAIILNSATFYGCTALKTIIFPKEIGLIWVHYRALYNCKSLQKLVLPETCSSRIIIEKEAFKNCKSLQKLVFPQSCTGSVKIDKEAFRNCTSLQSVKFPRTCKELKIGNDSFRNCTSLKSINLPKKCAPISIGYRAFRNCRNLTKIYNAANIQKVYGGAFRDCVSLPSITYSEKISMIGKNAYYGCKNLKKVTVNGTKNAPKIYKNAFCGTADGIRFVTKNKSIANKWAAQLKNSGLKSFKVI